MTNVGSVQSARELYDENNRNWTEGRQEVSADWWMRHGGHRRQAEGSGDAAATGYQWIASLQLLTIDK
jgi:hypothetical protein